MEGEPAGALAALERAGAIRALPPSGTESPVGGSFRRALVFRGRFDPAPVRSRRAVVASKIEAVERYARARGCRSNAILRYFGEMCRGACGRCDSCGWDSERELPA
jgi:ATP-dependent DNA helicase RecQ